MTTETKSLGEALPEEIQRVSALRDVYLSLPGGAGFLGAALMKVSIDQAVKASVEGDVIAMVRAYEDLKGFEG